MDNDIYKKLKGMAHFSFFPEEEIKKISMTAALEKFSKDTNLAEQGKSSINKIYVLLKGQLSLYDEKKGMDSPTGYIKKGDIFGGISILLNAGISLRTVKVDSDCEFIIIPADKFMDLCARYEPFYEYFLDNFSKNMFDDSLSSIIETGHARHFLSGIAPFSFLPQNEIDDIAKKLKIMHYPADMVPFLQGRTRMGYFYILQKGSAERYYEDNQKKTLQEILSEGNTFGGISILMNDGISIRTLKIKEDSYFYILPKQEFLDLCSRNQSFSEYFTDTFGKRMLNHSYASIIARTLQPKSDDMQIFNQTVESIFNKKIVFGKADISIRDAAEIMRGKKSSFIIIQSEDNIPQGIVTERDLAWKVTAEDYDISSPVKNIMSSPLKTIHRKAMSFEALITMMKEDISNLPVKDSSNNIIGTITNSEFINAQELSPFFLFNEIYRAKNLKDIIDLHDKLPQIIKNLITNGANSRNVTRFISTMSDAILKKIMEFALYEAGPAPVEFAFMILGSEGRMEQTLKTDQDNAIIYNDPLADEEKKVRGYFLKLGNLVCTMLDRAGYTFCNGEIMANNPKWCQPISKWMEYFKSWILDAKPENLLDASIFFDFRTGYGSEDLINRLRKHLFSSLGGWSGFFRNLTENALHFKPPLGFFRNFVVESKGEHRNTFNIKHAIMPIVDFARIYAKRLLIALVYFFHSSP